MSEETKKSVAEIFLILGDACRGIAEVCDRQVSLIAAPHIGESETEYDKLKWATVTPTGKDPLEVAKAEDHKDNELHKKLTTEITVYLGRADTKGHTYAQKEWKNYYWLGRDGDICRRKKKR